LQRPSDCELMGPEDQRVVHDGPSYHSSHSSFGETSVVPVVAPPITGGKDFTKIDFDDIEIPSMSTSSTEMTDSTSGSVPKASAQPAPRTQPVTLTFAEAYRANAAPVDFRFLPIPPNEHRMFRFDGDRGIAFTITLEFTGFGRPTQGYRVFENLTVRILHYKIAVQILRIDPRGIRMFVQGQRLFHRGTISDRFDPDNPAVQTPYLVRDSVVEIRLVLIDDFGPVSRAVNFWGNTISNNDVPLSRGVDISPVSSLPAMELPSTEMDGTDIDQELIGFTASPDPVRSITGPPVRASSRVRAQREGTSLDRVLNVPTRHRPVGDRWYYTSGELGESESEEPRNLVLSSIGPISVEEPELSVGSSSVEEPDLSELPLTRFQSTQLIKKFDLKGRNRRSIFKAKIHRVWTSRARPQQSLDATRGDRSLVSTEDFQILWWI
jgi:hypothetical protein